MAKRTEDLELEDINRVDDVTRVRDEEESSFIENNRPLDESIIIIDTPIPNVRRDAGVMRRAYTQDKKNFLRKELGIKINKRDAEELFDNMSLTVSDGKVDGAKYNGVKVLVTQDGIIGYNLCEAHKELSTSSKVSLRKQKQSFQIVLLGTQREELLKN